MNELNGAGTVTVIGSYGIQKVHVSRKHDDQARLKFWCLQNMNILSHFKTSGRDEYFLVSLIIVLFFCFRIVCLLHSLPDTFRLYIAGS